MKKQHYSKFAAILSGLVLIGFGALSLDQNVSAAAEGSIAGTVKLDGTAPHMRGIDMSKDPYCVKQHENSPITLGERRGWSKRWVGERRSLYFGRSDRQ